MVSIIVIDDGINIKDENINNCVVERYRINDNGEVIPEVQNNVLEISHGGCCAYIIHDICKQVKFTSVSILQSNGKCSGKKLKYALEWCQKQQCDIIHMSLSTRNYYTYQLIRDAIQTLHLQNKIIVSSIDNRYLVSYPAFCENVLAVFMDFSLSKGEVRAYQTPNGHYLFGIQYYEWIENIDGKKLLIDNENSYAASAFTGKISHLLNEASKQNIKQKRKYVLKMLFESTDIIEIQVPKFYRRGKRTIPVIGVMQCNYNFLYELSNLFEIDGYQSVTLAKKNNYNHIPFEFYLDDKENIDELFLCDMEKVYCNDIIFLQIESVENIKTYEIDVVITKDNGFFEVEINQIKKYFKDTKKIYQYIIENLQEE